MDKFRDVNGTAAVWLLPNIDTDVITPMKRMLQNSDELERYAFESFRFVGGDGDKGDENPDFPLNKPENRGAKIMIVGDNFGCGSSRETAAIAIAKLGIRCLISTSFGGIFEKNCFQQGILPIRLAPEQIDSLVEKAADLSIDLDNEAVITSDGDKIPFAVNPLRRTALLEGLSDVEMTLRKKAKIDAYFESIKRVRPWI